MKNIYRSPITTIVGIIIALFTLVGLTGIWFDKLDYMTVLLLTSTSVALLFGKDTLITRLIKK